MKAVPKLRAYGVVGVLYPGFGTVFRRINQILEFLFVLFVLLFF
jgi:hypothetical protein